MPAIQSQTLYETFSALFSLSVIRKIKFIPVLQFLLFYPITLEGRRGTQMT